MKTFSTPRLYGFNIRRRERGITLIFVVVAIFALLGVAALAIDLVTLYVSKAEAQRVADAAALAGAKGLIDSGVTADPSNSQNDWTDACAQASAQAQGVAAQGRIGGSPPPPGNVTITFGSGGALGAACPNSGTPGTGFGVNPEIGVTVRSAALPLFLAKIWGQRTSTVSATALAEGFNPSGTNVPVAARCVAPWLLANIDPGKTFPTPGAITRIMRIANGQIRSPGPTPTGIIGQRISLQAGCAGTANCAAVNPPISGPGPAPPPPPPPAFMTYYPINLGTPAASGPSCSLLGWSNYMQNIAACNPTPIACGSTVTLETVVYPDGPSNQNAINCQINASAPGPGNGQDTLNPGFPASIAAGAANPLATSGAITTGDVISSSRSIVTIPIYDSNPGNTTVRVAPSSTVVVTGFAQAFVESVSPGAQGLGGGRPQITILNVSGCRNGATGTPVGTNAASSVPVRLIHP